MLAFQLQSGQFIYFDAITRYDRRYSSSVSKQPISSGGNITDNITRENPELSFSAFVSNGSWSNIVDFQGLQFLETGEIGFANNRPYVEAVSITTDTGQFTKYLPDSLTQFFVSGTPGVNMQGSSGEDWVLSLENTLLSLRDNEEVFTLYEFDSKGSVRKTHEDVTLTSLNFSEDTDTGDGLNIEVTLEKIFFVTAETTTVPKDVADSVSAKAKPKETKGQIGPGAEGGSGAQPDPVVPNSSFLGGITSGAGSVDGYYDSLDKYTK